MGNPRFKLSDMMPNAWFYKLKDVNSTTSANALHPHPTKKSTNRHLTNSEKKASVSSLPPDANPRKSYYFTRDVGPGLPDPPRSSSKHARTPRKSSKPKAKPAAPPPPLKPGLYSSASFSCRAVSTDSAWTRTEVDPDDSPDSICDSSSPEFRLDRVLTPESRGSCGSRTDPAVADDHDVVIYVDENSFVAKPKRPMVGLKQNSDSLTKLELPRIITKPAKPKPGYGAHHVADFDDRNAKKPAKKFRESKVGSQKSVSKRYSLSSSPRLRLKINSPRLSARRPALARKTGMGGGSEYSSSALGRRKLSGSFAIVKSSFDPQRDFRESMLEMIIEHNIKASKDLEELLACYLSLNSDEYHELIIEVFKQIWFDLTDVDTTECH